jgi:Antibiotic biosynthesis monooxygenase
VRGESDSGLEASKAVDAPLSPSTEAKRRTKVTPKVLSDESGISALLSAPRQRRDTMVITVLEARVVPHNREKLIAAYSSSIKNPDPGIVETFLANATEDRTLWRILTVWEDREALESMRNSGVPPRGVLIFGEADAKPNLTILDVSAHARS